MHICAWYRLPMSHSHALLHATTTQSLPSLELLACKLLKYSQSTLLRMCLGAVSAPKTSGELYHKALSRLQTFRYLA